MATEQPIEPPTATVVEEPTPTVTESAPAAEPAPAVAQTSASEPTKEPSSPAWPALDENHPLSKLLADLPEILKSTGHEEVYGVTLKPKTGAEPDFGTLIILQKFLRANQDDISKAKEQLTKTLEWRKEFNPLAAKDESFSTEKFAGLGYLTEITDPDAEGKKVSVTWNVYGAVKDYEKTFVPLDEFIRWRIALMEFGVSKLNLASATTPIPDYGKGLDRYQGIQVHDYLNVSFLRMDPRAKAASKKTIEILGAHYPETLSRKFFVNVPIVMQWMFAAMKLFVSKETTKKFTVLSYGEGVAAELGTEVPNEYGGKGGKLSEVGETLKLA